MFQNAVDKWHDYLQKDKVYRISRGQVKMADRRYSSIKNLYELTLVRVPVPPSGGGLTGRP
jgi:replication factor A1